MIKSGCVFSTSLCIALFVQSGRAHAQAPVVTATITAPAANALIPRNQNLTLSVTSTSNQPAQNYAVSIKVKNLNTGVTVNTNAGVVNVSNVGPTFFFPIATVPAGSSGDTVTVDIQVAGGVSRGIDSKSYKFQ